MKNFKTFSRTFCAVSALSLQFATGSAVNAFEGQVPPGAAPTVEHYSPFIGRAYPDRVLFGDLHFHTEISFDAGLIGTSLNIHDASRVARGEKILSNTGQAVQLIRPLDFLAITERAEMLGLATAMRRSDHRLVQDEWGGRIHDQFNAGQEQRMAAFGEILKLGTDARDDPDQGG